MIGVDDDGIVVGVEKETVEGVASIIRDGCVPPLIPHVNKKNFDGKQVITVGIEANQDVPYSTKDGRYYIRVGATVRIASLLELIDLIAKGPHRDRLLSKIQIPQLESSISASLRTNADLEQALVSIDKLAQFALSIPDETIKIEVIGVIGRLLKIHCDDDKIIQDLLLILASITSNDLAQNHYAPRPSNEIFRLVIEILEQVFLSVTLIAQVTARTKIVLHAFHMVGLGCMWAGYDDHFKKIFEILGSQRGRDRKLDTLCDNTVDKLLQCAKEEPSYPPRRMGMLVQPFMQKTCSERISSWFRRH